MSSSNTHIINKVLVEIDTKSKEKAYQIKDNINSFINDTLFPRLSEYFDAISLNPEDRFIQIESLNIEVDLGAKEPLKELEPIILKKVQEKIFKLDIQTSGVDKNSGFSIKSSKDKTFDSWVYFLDNGTDVWWESSNSYPLLLENNFLTDLNSSDRKSRLYRVLHKKTSLLRLINQFEDEVITKVFEILFSDFRKQENDLNLFSIEKLNLEASRYSGTDRKNFWAIIFSKIINYNDQQEIVDLFIQILNNKLKIRNHNLGRIREFVGRKTINTAIPELLLKIDQLVLELQNNFKSTTESEKTLSKDFENPDIDDIIKKQSEENLKVDKKTLGNNAKEKNARVKEVERILKNIEDLENQSQIESSEDVYVNNAGLILTHPFLNQLFSTCQLINKEGEIVDKETAVHLLHYVATGREMQTENLMVFEKFICNIPILYPINRFVKLPEEFKKNADEMLEALLNHWAVLKNSSIDLLRNEFLQRSGKIIFSGSRPRIIIERKTQDILLDKIPWNISLIKLPWQDKLLFVDW